LIFNKDFFSHLFEGKGFLAKMTSIEIPLRESTEVVEVFLDELPEDPQEISVIIADESAPISLYYQFAVHLIQLRQCIYSL